MKVDMVALNHARFCCDTGFKVVKKYIPLGRNLYTYQRKLIYLLMERYIPFKWDARLLGVIAIVCSSRIA